MIWGRHELLTAIGDNLDDFTDQGLIDIIREIYPGIKIKRISSMSDSDSGEFQDDGEYEVEMPA